MAKLVTNLPESLYHADPCEKPSLTATIANILERQSPAHAFHAHPRLGGEKRERSATLDKGTALHAMLLGTEPIVMSVDADDWRTKAARERREEIEAQGAVAMLRREHEALELVVDLIRQRFVEFGIDFDGDSEISAFWEETTTAGASVLCRGRLDHLSQDRSTIFDLKMSRSASPISCVKHVESYGYDVQSAAYTRAVEKAHPELAGRVDFVFLFAELEGPIAVTPVRLDTAFREIGTRKWLRAVETWERCLRTDHWPTYVSKVTEISPPPWSVARELDRQLDDDAQEDRWLPQ